MLDETGPRHPPCPRNGRSSAVDVVVVVTLLGVFVSPPLLGVAAVEPRVVEALDVRQVVLGAAAAFARSRPGAQSAACSSPHLFIEAPVQQRANMRTRKKIASEMGATRRVVGQTARAEGLS